MTKPRKKSSPRSPPPAQPARHRAAIFDRIAGHATRATGSAAAFLAAVAVIVAWAVLGPAFGYSETWQLVVNTGTTIVTFLMVFLIQHAQNKDSVALHLKLNELIAAQPQASNRLIAVEDLDEQELRLVSAYYEKLADLARESGHLQESHSTSTARAVHHAHLRSTPPRKAVAAERDKS